MSKGARGASQRQLRVGELVRQVLGDILQRGEVRHPDVAGVPITITEVRMSPDLKAAVAYVMPLGGKNTAEVLAGLRLSAAFLRGRVGREVKLRFAPELRFEADPSFDTAGRIEALLDKRRGGVRERGDPT
jgi:ribosome-binding factor A